MAYMRLQIPVLAARQTSNLFIGCGSMIHGGAALWRNFIGWVKKSLLLSKIILFEIFMLLISGTQGRGEDRRGGFVVCNIPGIDRVLIL